MSAPEKAETQAPAEQPTAEAKKPTLEEILARLEAAQSENAKAINVMAAAIVKLNEKIEAKPTNNPSGTDSLTALAQILSPKGGSMDEFARTAESFAKAADALEHFRHPSPIGLGEAYLMRLGLRAAYPRYTTKAELDRIERERGILAVLEGEEGEGHVKE